MHTATRTGPREIPGERAWTDNWTRGAGTLHMEIIHPESGGVWLTQEAVSDESAAALSMPDGFLPSGIGEAVADEAFFRRSPGAAVDGPLDTMAVEGVRFCLVARPGVPETGLAGVLVLPVEKHHVVRYAAGRTIEIMDCGDGGDYVPLTARVRRIGADPGRPTRDRVLPDGWSVRSVTLAVDLVVELPCPTRAAFFLASGDSFQGPLRLGL